MDPHSKCGSGSWVFKFFIYRTNFSIFPFFVNVKTYSLPVYYRKMNNFWYIHSQNHHNFFYRGLDLDTDPHSSGIVDPDSDPDPHWDFGSGSAWSGFRPETLLLAHLALKSACRCVLPTHLSSCPAVWVSFVPTLFDCTIGKYINSFLMLVAPLIWC